MTVAFFDHATDGLPSTLHAAQFTGLASAPPVSDYPQGGGTFASTPLLLPWRAAPLAVFDIFAPLYLVRSFVLPPGTATAPPDLTNTLFGNPNGYADPQSGTLVVTPSNTTAGAVVIYELAP
jgi:hypothetical protein